MTTGDDKAPLASWQEMRLGSPDPTGELAPGDVVAEQFEVVRKLGRGGMGFVYEVNDRVVRQHLALKVVQPAVFDKPQSRDIFLREISMARRLRHPGIAPVYDVREWGGLLMFTMEYLKGHTLRRIINEHKRLTFPKAIGLVYRVYMTLEYAHQFMAHRDLCPENIMVMPDGSTQLLDFGIARVLETGAAGTAPRLGKAFYKAPEQLNDPAAVDIRADVYSLGVLLFELLTGELPTGYNRLENLCPDLPRECDDLMARALAPRDKRFPSVGAFWNAALPCFQKWELEQQQKASAPAPEPAPPSPTQTPLPMRAQRLVQSKHEMEWEEWERRREKLAEWDQ